MSVSPARRAALRALGRVRERDAYAPETLDAVLSSTALSPKDTALATRLTYGTLQTLGVLDGAIDRFAERPSDIEPRVRDALRIATYELLFLRTPRWAAVNEAVDSVRRARPQAAGLANAVLRRVAEQADSFPWGDPDADDAALARMTAHPEWMVGLLVDDLGRDVARGILEDSNEPAPLYLWHNPFAGPVDDALEVLRSDGAGPSLAEPPGCIVTADAAAAVRGAAVARSLVLVCDAAGQIAPRALGAHPGDAVIDLAAGRGTKTVQIQACALAAGGPARIWAVDVHAFKTRVLTARLSQLGVPGVTVLQGDATDAASIAGLPEPGCADAVLLDVPCSGLGTLRRRPEKRWRISIGDIDALSALQAALVRQAAMLVRPGGVVVYSTCSLARRENHDVVSGFLGGVSGDAFRTRSIADAVPPAWAGWVGPEGWFQSVPRRGGPDGHFVAVLERTG